MSLQHVCLALLVLALAIGSGRLLFGVWRRSAATKPKSWRVAALVLLQAGSAVLLYFTLFPPMRFAPAQQLTVLTAKAQAADAGPAAGRIVALPEAGRQAGVERVADLASALRRYPGTDRVHILGQGLPVRDTEAARGLSVRFKPSPLPEGVIALHWPMQLAPGMRWQLHGQVNYRQPVTLELLDPAGAVVNRAPADAQGKIRLSDAVRGPGQADYRLRVVDARRKALAVLDVPLKVVAPMPLRLLMLSGGPNPELKYIRRWAADAGLAVESRIELGQGMRIQTDQAALTAANLREQDLLILDERAWNGLGVGGRRTVIAAVNDGLGLMLRVTGPVGAGANDLRALGVSIQENAAVQGVKLPSDPGQSPLPELNRRPVRVQSPDGVVMLRTDKDEPLAIWRAQGQGRVAVWWLTDTYKLALGDASSRHNQLWAEAAAVLARSRDLPALQNRQQHLWVNQRLTVCGLSDTATVLEPDGRSRALLIDDQGANPGCAGFWPTQPGWHTVAGKAAQLPFYVRGANEAPGLKANALRESTLALLGESAHAGEAMKVPVPGPQWPYFLAWLLVTALLWALERTRWAWRQ
jgi:hypothetical protein